MSAAVRTALLLAAALLLPGCATLGENQRRQAVALAEAARPAALTCDREDACARPSPLRELGDRALAETAAQAAPRHYALLLEYGQDALVARINLIRSARESIEVQSFIYAEDDSGYFVMRELVAAARRGVRVRVLLDQMFSVENTRLAAALAGVHQNFELRLYNPTFNNAHTNYFQFAAGVVLRFRNFNQRMHNKLLLVDGVVGITGGRNYQDRYFDWDPEFNYRDRDILVAGPVGEAMRANFEAFWAHPRAVTAARLDDVGRQLLAHDGPPRTLEQIGLEQPAIKRPDRVEAVLAAADDAEALREGLAAHAIPVGRVDFLADLPDKHEGGRTRADASHGLRALIEGAREQVLLQTPYLVLSREARRMFRRMQRRPDAPEVVVSTNSLAATDAFPVYALSHKYKRTYLRELGFRIHEYKPFPLDAPIDVLATGALDQPPEERAEPPRAPNRAFGSARAETGSPSGPTSESTFAAVGSGARRGPLPLRSAGVRVGLHAKSLVIDRRVGIVGTHNFDPRSDNFNTESAVAIYDTAFVDALSAEIERDLQPENAWVVARRVQDWTPVVSDINYNLGKLFEALPLFDLWPVRYATSYEFVPGPDCAPAPPDTDLFRACYRPVGDFPEVDVPTKSIYTRILTAFGAGLAPIL
ncbi:phospholipase D family protein [Coralloluteibacterium thermophilus]|uniref:Phospholipase D family protein n=1 Tax=Coralloluteibacterium thermophilum TaxID=2707049 RepID=A0ABV9NKD2_9GAMM